MIRGDIPGRVHLDRSREILARARNGVPYDNVYAVVFRVAGGLIEAVTEYCDTSCMNIVLFGQ